MEQSLENTAALLARTPAALNAFLRDLPEEWINRDEGEGTWTVFEVIGHLVYCERANWMPRLHQFGKGEQFKNFDRRGFTRESEGKSLGQLLDEFASLRVENLADLRALNLRPVDLETRAEHPALGPVILSQLLATWAAHDLTHLHQITRIMAFQYREAVGPWVKYLGVMQCQGHSAQR